MTNIPSILANLFRLLLSWVAALLLAGCQLPSYRDGGVAVLRPGDVSSQTLKRDASAEYGGTDLDTAEASANRPSPPPTSLDDPGIPGLIWSLNLDGEVSYTAVNEGVVYVWLEDDRLYALDAGNGEILLHLTPDTPQYLTAFGDGLAYFGSEVGQVLALNAGTFDLRWRFDAGKQMTGYPRASEDVVYFSTSGTLFSLDAKTGELRWRFEEKERPSFHPFAKFDGNIYLSTPDGYLYSFDIESGKLHWRWQAEEWNFYTLELVEGIIVASYDYHNALYALDAATGENIWRFAPERPLETRATVANGTVYFYSFDGPSDDRTAYIYALDAATGRQIWRTPLAIGADLYGPSFNVAAGTVYFGSTDGNVYALNATNGAPKWRHDTGDEEVGSITVAEGVVYVITEQLGVLTGIIYALDSASGDLLWRSRESMDGLSSTLIIVDGVIYVSANDGGVYALDAFDGEILWRLRTSRRVWLPVLVDGVLYAAADEGDVYAVDVASALQANSDHRAQTVAAPELLWRYDSGSELYEAPLVAGGVVYAGTSEGGVLALGAGDGALLWRYDQTEKALYAWAVVSEGIVYDTTWNGFVVALDASNGEILWRNKVGERVHSQPAVSDGILYLSLQDHNSDDQIYALDATSGDRLWQFELGGHLEESSWEIAGDTLYVGTPDGHMNALNAASGAIRWRHATDAELFNVPVVAGDAVYFGASDDVFYALDAASGDLLWRMESGNILGAHPTVVEGVVYLGTQAGYLYALDAAGGEKLWRFNADGSLSSPAVVEGVVYVGSTDGFVYALDAETGETVWQRYFPLGGKHHINLAVSEDGWEEIVFSYFTPSVIEGVLYLAMEDGSAYALDAATGDSLWRYKTGDYIYSPPAVADGVVYVGSVDGYLYALRDSQPVPDQDAEQ